MPPKKYKLRLIFNKIHGEKNHEEIREDNFINAMVLQDLHATTETEKGKSYATMVMRETNILKGKKFVKKRRFSGEIGESRKSEREDNSVAVQN